MEVNDMNNLLKWMKKDIPEEYPGSIQRSILVYLQSMIIMNFRRRDDIRIRIRFDK